MPLLIIVMLIVVLFIITIVSLDNHIKVSMGCFAGLLSLILWLIVAGVQEDVERERIDFVVHTSPDGYQYITLDDKPLNVTKRFGKIIPDGAKIQAVIYEDMVYGIDYPDTYLGAYMEIVEQ